MAMARLAAALGGVLALPGASALLYSARQDPAEVALAKSLIPGTAVPMPADYEDYTRGHTPWRLFKGKAPGKRKKTDSPGPGLPTFDPSDPEGSKEVFMDALPTDYIGHMCAPGGDAAGHYFYNVWDPELIPYLVDQNRSDFKNTSVIVAPGGGNLHLAWEAEGIAQAEWLNSLGISAFVLKYRVPHSSGELRVMDGQRAVILVRARAKAHGLDPHRVGFMGSSAGGETAIAVASAKDLSYSHVDDMDKKASANSARPDFLLLLYPGIQMGFLKKEALKRLPKTFVAYAANDPCVPAAIARPWAQMAKAEIKAPVEVIEYADGKHGWGSCDYYPQFRGMDNCNWRQTAEAFIRKNVMGES